MEGKTGPESGQSQPPSPTPEKSTETAPQRQSWRSRLAKKIPLPARVIAGLTLFGGAATGTVVGISEIAQSGSNQANEPSATVHIDKPPSATDQVVEITPTPIETSPTAQATPTPAPVENPTPTPTTKETTPIPEPQLSSWTVDVEYSGPSHFRTLEQDQAILSSVMEKFPHVGNIKIVLTSGTTSATFVNPDLQEPILIKAGRDAYDFERRLYNEFARVFNVRQPEVYQRLVPYYSQEQLTQMQQISDKIASKWRNYPSIEKMFAPDKTGQTTKNHFTAYPDALFIIQSDDLKVPGYEWRYPLEEPIFTPYLDTTILDKLSSDIPEDRIGYLNFSQFYQGEKSKMDTLKNSDPVHNLALTILEENMPHLANWQWTSTQNLRLDTKFLRNYWREVLPVFEQIALLQALGTNDPRLPTVFSPEQIQNMKNKYQILVAAADNELQDTIYEQVLIGVEQEDLMSQYHQIVWSPFR